MLEYGAITEYLPEKYFVGIEIDKCKFIEISNNTEYLDKRILAYVSSIIIKYEFNNYNSKLCGESVKVIEIVINRCIISKNDLQTIVKAIQRKMHERLIVVLNYKNFMLSKIAIPFVHDSRVKQQDIKVVDSIVFSDWLRYSMFQSAFEWLNNFADSQTNTYDSMIEDFSYVIELERFNYMISGIHGFDSEDFGAYFDEIVNILGLDTVEDIITLPANSQMFYVEDYSYNKKRLKDLRKDEIYYDVDDKYYYGDDKYARDEDEDDNDEDEEGYGNDDNYFDHLYQDYYHDHNKLIYYNYIKYASKLSGKLRKSDYVIFLLYQQYLEIEDLDENIIYYNNLMDWVYYCWDDSAEELLEGYKETLMFSK